MNPAELSSLTTDQRYQFYKDAHKPKPTEPASLTMQDIGNLSAEQRANLYEQRRINKENRAAEIQRRLTPERTQLEIQRDHLQERIESTNGHEIYTKQFAANAKEIAAEAKLENRLSTTEAKSTIETYEKYYEKLKSNATPEELENLQVSYKVWRQDPSNTRTTELFSEMSEIIVATDDRHAKAVKSGKQVDGADGNED